MAASRRGGDGKFLLARSKKNTAAEKHYHSAARLRRLVAVREVAHVLVARQPVLPLAVPIAEPRPAAAVACATATFARFQKRGDAGIAQHGRDGASARASLPQYEQMRRSLFTRIFFIFSASPFFATSSMKAIQDTAT